MTISINTGLASAAFAAACIAAQPSAAAVTFLQASIASESRAFAAETRNNVTLQDSESQSASDGGTAPATYSATTRANAVAGEARVSAYSGNGAVFFSAASGYADFSSTVSTRVERSGGLVAASNYEGFVFGYRFLVDTASTMTFNLNGSRRTNYAPDTDPTWDVDLSGPSAFSVQGAGIGLTSLSLAPGQYALGVKGFNDSFLQTGLGSHLSDYDAEFYFSIVAEPIIPMPGVPEPASWALLIAGFGLTGTAMRRRALRSVAA